MNNRLEKYNMKIVEKAVKGVNCKTVMVNDVWAYGVKNIAFEHIPINDSIPKELRDGSEENVIKINIDFKDGSISTSFCPEREVCEVLFETDELLIFRIRDTDDYIKQEELTLEFMKMEYEAYMNA